SAENRSEKSCKLCNRVPSHRIMPPMTQALSRANWIGPPSPCQLLLETLLRVAAMLWSNVAATFRMIPSRPARECHTMQTPQALPGEMRDPIKETDLAAERSEPTEALILMAGEAGVSNHEGVLTSVEPKGITSPWKGEVGASEACDGWGSLRPTPADQSDPHPAFDFVKAGPPPSRGRGSAALATS
ncbi:MAG: hypothetical protein Q8R02_14910, partial [Hyphomonadaceae bacterium]|nr:hypothetical protein [Hyphomonadaceae bacterium]